MRTELCQFSGLKIYPGHGKRYARIDGKVFNLLNAKCAALLLKKKNPRKIAWTVLYRRKHKKGTMEEVVKKRSRRTQKHNRSIQGVSWSEIMARRNQKPEVRKAQREQAIRIAKEKKRAVEQQKRATKSQTKQAPKQKVAQKVRKAAPVVGGKR